MLSWAKLDSAELSLTELSCLSAAQAQDCIRIRLPRTGGAASAPRPRRARTIPGRAEEIRGPACAHRAKRCLGATWALR